MDNSKKILCVILKAFSLYISSNIQFPQNKSIQMQSLELFKHTMFTISYLEVSILQKHSTNKFMTQILGDGDTKQLYIISMIKETRN